MRNVLGIHCQLYKQLCPTIQKRVSLGLSVKKRAKYKQFFLSCTAESVNKGQIYSYLHLTLKITPNNISTFRSKRRGTISAEVSVSFLLCSSDVLEDTFWPKHVRCKPCVPNERRAKSIVQQNIKIPAGNYSTYVCWLVQYQYE
jgi:hypothetical protein